MIAAEPQIVFWPGILGGRGFTAMTRLHRNTQRGRGWQVHGRSNEPACQAWPAGIWPRRSVNSRRVRRVQPAQQPSRRCDELGTGTTRRWTTASGNGSVTRRSRSSTSPRRQASARLCYSSTPPRPHNVTADKERIHDRSNATTDTVFNLQTLLAEDPAQEADRRWAHTSTSRVPHAVGRQGTGTRRRHVASARQRFHHQARRLTN